MLETAVAANIIVTYSRSNKRDAYGKLERGWNNGISDSKKSGMRQ